jgi:hypothetical protein
MVATTQDHRFSPDLDVEADSEQDARWNAVQELATSPLFIRSPRLSQLLLYLATQTLRHRGAEITEQEIARSVFLRGEDFHPSSDTIVRSHLVRLRQRLEQYRLQMAGKSDRFCISVPRGQYAVVFLECEVPALLLPQSKSESEPIGAQVALGASSGSELKSKRLVDSAVRFGKNSWMVPMILLIVLGAGYALRLRASYSEPALTNPMWLGMFTANETTNVVAADSSLVILHQYLRHDTSLAEYVSGNYRQSARTELAKEPEIFNIGNRRYTSMVDASIVQHVGELANRSHAKIEAHFAREFTIGDLKRGNTILSGSRGADPWVELFEPQMNFTVTNDYENNSVYVKNWHPMPGESERYIEGSGEPGKPLYGVLAYLPNLEQPRNVLILEGSSLAATQGIVDLVFNEQSLLPILKKMLRKDGSLAHFEVLVASTVVNGNASKFQIVAYRLID